MRYTQERTQAIEEFRKQFHQINDEIFDYYHAGKENQICDGLISQMVEITASIKKLKQQFIKQKNW